MKLKKKINYKNDLKQKNIIKRIKMKIKIKNKWEDNQKFPIGGINGKEK
jgi:hypothetical protein